MRCRGLRLRTRSEVTMLVPAGLTLLVSGCLAAGAPCQGEEALCLGNLVTHIAVGLLRVAQLLQQPEVGFCMPPQ